jgi:hypothetical protein
MKKKIRKSMFQFDEMMGLFLLVFAFLIIVGIISHGNIAGLFDVFRGVPKSYDIAKYSADVLACAIRNVAAGEKVCVMPGMEEGGSELTGFFARLLGRATAQEPEEERIDIPEDMRSALSCGNPQGKIRCEYCGLRYAGGEIKEKYLIYADNEDEAEKMCEKYIRENGGLGPYVVPEGDPGLSWWSFVEECEKVEVESCKVNNFYIPLDFESTPVATAREYIEGYGDPVLVYWQQFPPGEDASWNGWSPLFQGIGTVFFASMCFTRIVGGFFVLPPMVAKMGIVRASHFSQLRGLSNWVDDIARKVSTKTGGAVTSTRALVGNIDDAYVSTTTWVSKRSVARKLMDAIRSGTSHASIINKPAARKVMKATGLISADAYLAARYRTELGKFVEPYPDSLVLLNPLNNFSTEAIDLNIEPYRKQQYIVNPTRQNLVDLKRPVLLHKESSVGSGHLIPLTLAGPCHADLEVTPEDVTCGFYYYNSEGYVTCETPILRTLWSEKVFGRKNRPMCGSLPTGLRQEFTETFSNKEAEIIEKINNVRIFDEPDENGRWQKIIDPIHNVTYYYNTTTNEFYKIVLPDGSVIEELHGGWGSKPVPDVLWCRDASTFLLVDNDDFITSDEKIYYCDIHSTGYSFFEEDIYGIKDVGFSFMGIKSDKIGTDFAAFGNLTEKKFYGIKISQIVYKGYPSEVGFYINSILKDSNGDGMVDSVLHEMYYPGSITIYSFFSDDDFDGDIDTLASNNCVVPAIIVRADASKYDDDPNYCYQKDRAWVGTAIMVGSFVFDSLAKVVGGPLGYIIGAGIDCGLAALNVVVQDEWPRGGIR